MIILCRGKFIEQLETIISLLLYNIRYCWRKDTTRLQ